MVDKPDNAGAPQPRATFYVNSHATGWWWYPRGAGFLYCFDGLLRFEHIEAPLLGRLFKTPLFEHTSPRIVLASPSIALPNYYTVVIFEHGKIAISIPGNADLIRSTLASCGFQVVETPRRRTWPRKLRQIWQEYGESPG